MAQVDVVSGRFSGSRTVLGPFKKAIISSVSAEEIVLVAGASRLTIGGTGFAQAPGGDIVDGVAETLLISNKGLPQATFTDLAIPAADLVGLIRTSNSLGFDEAAFPNDDTLNGGDDADSFVGLAGNDVLNGNDGADVLDGGEGDDEIDGGSGADRMIGGLGDDLFIVDSAGDKVTEAKDGGNDTVETSVTFNSSRNVEKLILTGTASIDATGDNAANILIGNEAQNRLDGSGGADELRGGAGADTLTGGKKADRFVIDTLEGGADTILDFDVRKGDVLDLSEVLPGYDGSDPTDFVNIIGSGKSAVVLIDQDGGGDSFVPAVTIIGDIGVDVTTLVDQGVIQLFPSPPPEV